MSLDLDRFLDLMQKRAVTVHGSEEQIAKDSERYFQRFYGQRTLRAIDYHIRSFEPGLHLKPSGWYSSEHTFVSQVALKKDGILYDIDRSPPFLVKKDWSYAFDSRMGLYLANSTEHRLLLRR
jgi:hypothetical protein